MPQSLLLLLLQLLLPVSWAGSVHVTAGSSKPCRLEQLPAQTLKILTCSGDEVTTVPTVEAGLAVKFFYLDGCPLADIGPDSFANLTGSLTYISMRTTVPIANLNGDAFRNLNLLAELRIVASGMQETAANPAKLLATLASLTFLHLENLKIGHLPSEFAASTKLSTIRLINADIVSIAPDAFTRLPSLNILEFCKNPASAYITDLLRQIGSVEELTMTGCGLTQIRATASFSRLRRINMASNQITLLDLTNLAGLGATLEELNLSTNKLGASGLPGLELLTSLKRLYLTSNNVLKQMPNNLGQLEGLELLDARLTSVTNIRVGDFHEKSRLTSLTLDEAQLSFVEVIAFQRLSQLMELSFTVPSSSFLVRSVTDRQPATWSELLGHLPALRNLSLSGSAVTHGVLDNSVWPGLAASHNLRRLILEYNAITSVPDFQFAVARLDRLSLSGNTISSLNSASLYGLAPNAQVKLQDIGLSTLDNCSLAGLTSLAGVDLSHNPWRCDCSLVWLFQRLRAESAASLAGINCDQPDSLRGRSWSGLSVDDFCPPGASGEGVPPCEVRVPPSTAPPTPTAFPYALDFRLSMEPGDELLVRFVLNTSGLASRFDRYSVRFGLDSEFDLSSRFQEALISVHTLIFHLDSVELHRFCVVLQGPDLVVDSSKNCRTFSPAKSSPQLTVGHISAAVVVPIAVLGLIGIIIFCLVSKRTKRKKAVQAAMARRAAEDYSYTYLDSDNPNNAGNPRFQSARKPESRQFTKRSGGNTLGGSRPSLTASASNLQQQLQQMQQVQQMQQMQQMQAHRMHSLSQVSYQPDAFASAGSTGGWDPRAMRASRSTDHLSMAASGPQGGPGRARSQEFGIDRPMLTRSRSGFGQYPQHPDEEVPPPLPARNPSRSIPHMEDPEAYEEMGS